MEHMPGQLGDIPSAESYWAGNFNYRLGLLQQVAFPSPRSDGTIPHSDQMRVAVDSELAALSRIAQGSQSLLRFRNSLSPICQVPPKLLCRIFARLAVLDPPTRNEVEHPDGRVVQFKLGWINATHVCQHWRDTALHEPGLWQEILISFGPEWLRETLIRSKAAPISVQWASKDADASCLAFIPLHLSHIKSLTLDGPSFVSTAIMRSLKIPSLLLEQLRLSNTSREPSSLTLPGGFLARNAPRLRSVHLKRYPMLLPLKSPPSPTFSHLVRLIMEADVEALYHSWGQRSLIPVERLLAALQGMPALKYLHLQHSISLAAPHDLVRVICPDLQELYLQESDIGCINFLKRVEMPSLLELRMKCYYANLREDGLVSVVRSVSPHMAAIDSRVPFHVVDIAERLRSPIKIGVYAWKLNVSHWDELDCGPAECFVEFLHLPEMANVPASQAQAPSNAAFTFCHSLPSFDEVEWIIVESCAADKTWTAQSWRDLFGRSQSITGINVHGTLATRSLIETLNAPALIRTTKGQGSKPRFLEELDLISISEAHFEFCRLRDGEAYNLFEHLMQWLSALEENESDLPMLLITESNITRDMIEELECFTTVQWDEKAVLADSTWIQQV